MANNTVVNASIENGNTLVIRVPLNKPPILSVSGKSYIVAGTGGFADSSAVVNHGGRDKMVSVSVNAIIKLN